MARERDYDSPNTPLKAPCSDLDDDLAQGIARGELHPETLSPIQDQWPDYKPVGLKTVKRSEIPLEVGIL